MLLLLPLPPLLLLLLLPPQAATSAPPLLPLIKQWQQWRQHGVVACGRAQSQQQLTAECHH